MRWVLYDAMQKMPLVVIYRVRGYFYSCVLIGKDADRSGRSTEKGCGESVDG